MSEQNQNFVRVAPLDELQKSGVMVVRGAECPVAVFAHEGNVFAVDNRCPHLGFPLHRGSVQDGILTCHWHHARFDLCSGCTFDPFADDVPAFNVEVREGVVFVAANPRQAPRREYFSRRLREGMEQNISLIQAKSLVGLLKTGADYHDIIREVALFGVRNRNGFSQGLVLLTTVANTLPHLTEETRYIALYQATRQVAADCAGQSPRRPLLPLDSEDVSLTTLKRWLRYWTEVRHQEGAERTLLTAIHNGASQCELADMLFSAACDRIYADGGHLFDFCNKAFELLDIIGWDNASEVLPTLVPQLVRARGAEEMNSWRHPTDLVEALKAVSEELPKLLQQGAGKQWHGEDKLAADLLGEDAHQVIGVLCEALSNGARPEQLAVALNHAAAMRLARFSTANEVGDWFNPMHTFTYCNAVHQAIQRCPSAEVTRSIFHGAMSVYLDRFLNVPPARLPGEREKLSMSQQGAGDLQQAFLDSLDQRHEVEGAAHLVAQYWKNDFEIEPLFDTFMRATTREDLDFHAYQMVDATARQQELWQEDGEHILIAEARYLAAHCPTQRARSHTARIALRLQRGENLYEDEN